MKAFLFSFIFGSFLLASNTSYAQNTRELSKPQSNEVKAPKKVNTSVNKEVKYNNSTPENFNQQPANTNSNTVNSNNNSTNKSNSNKASNSFNSTSETKSDAGSLSEQDMKKVQSKKKRNAVIKSK